MPNDMINALLGQQTEMPQQPSPFGVEPPRPEDAIRNLYRSNAPKSSWLGGAAKSGESELRAPDTVDKILGTLSKFTPGPSDRGLPRPPEEGFWEGFQKQGILPAALMGARASGVRLTPSASPGRDPTLQLRGRYTRLQDHGAYMNHPAIGKWPFIASSQLAANLYGRDEVPEDSAPTIEHPSPHNNAPAMASNPVAERWGEMAPPRQEMPPPESLALQSGRFMPQPGGFPAAPTTSASDLDVVPMPRPNPLSKGDLDFAPYPKGVFNPFLPPKPSPKKREADASKDQPQHDWRRSGMMHMEQGGYNPGQPMVVGEGGDGSNEEVVIPHGPATVIPHSLAVQSGMIKAPPKAASKVDQLFENPGKPLREVMPNIGTAIAPTGALGALGSAIKAFPKTAATIGTGAGISGMTSGVGEAADQTVAGFAEPRPTLSKEDQTKLNVLNTEIEKHNATIARHAALKEDKPALYASRTAGALAALQRLTKEASDIEGPHRKNTEDWQNRLNAYTIKQQDALFNRQQKEADATTPFQTKNPDWGNEAPKWGAAVEGTLGGITGLASKGNLGKKLLKGGLAGMGTGTLLSLAPNLIDAGNLPLGSQSQKDAFWNMLTPDMATKVVSDAALGGGIGAASTYGTSTIKDGVNALIKLLKGPATRASSIPKAKILSSPVVAPPPVPTQPPPILPEAVVPTPTVKRSRKKTTK